MAFHTGMRRGEIMGLTWEKVDLQRRIPINSELYQLLKAMPGRLSDAGGERHFFQDNREPFRAIRDSLKKTCKKAGIKYGRAVRDGSVFHDLRHTFTTNTGRAGVPEREIMAITGYTSRSTFDRYSTVNDNDLRQAIE